MKVQILQGVSGAGKSTYVQWLIQEHGTPHVRCFSADDFFVVDGQYRFDRTKLSEAHTQCLRNYMWCLLEEKGVEFVVVDNTNTSVVEIAPYYQLAVALGHEVEIVTLITDPQVAGPRNVHAVPEKTVLSQWSRINGSWRHFPHHWKHRKIESGSGIPPPKPR